MNNEVKEKNERIPENYKKGFNNVAKQWLLFLERYEIKTKRRKAIKTKVFGLDLYFSRQNYFFSPKNVRKGLSFFVWIFETLNCKKRRRIKTVKQQLNHEFVNGSCDCLPNWFLCIVWKGVSFLLEGAALFMNGSVIHGIFGVRRRVTSCFRKQSQQEIGK